MRHRRLLDFVVQPPHTFRLFHPEAIWRIKVRGRKCAYLTFDDGPVPEVTPQVLDILDRYGVKATFFMVGQNAERHPELLEEVRRRGHAIGNHTMHHMHGRKCSYNTYLRDVAEANLQLRSTLFRPPYGTLSWRQMKTIQLHYNIVMYDVVSRDYARLITPEEVVENVQRFTRNGSVIVFHDSQRAAANLLPALPQIIEWLQAKGYELRPIGSV